MSDGQQTELALRVFDPDEDILVVERKLPHWAQPGTLCFITFRTRDSMPKPVLERWLDERRRWLRCHGIQVSMRHAPRDGHRTGNRHPEREGSDRDWRSQFGRLALRLQREYRETFALRWHEELDNGHGECVLRQAELAQIVASGIQHFDGERYELTDFVVMPNHVHVLAAFRDAEQMLAQCESWKHYTAMQINRRLNRKGHFWQPDSFDHLVRSSEQFEYLRRYIAANPAKANLRAGEFVHESKTVY